MKTERLFRLVGIGLVLWLGARHPVWAGAPVAADSLQKQTDKRSSEPDHLVPLDPNPGDMHLRYTKLLAEKFRSGGFCFARMERRPSFGGESSLRLHGKPEDRDIGKTKEVFITYSVAARSIWSSMNHDKKPREIKVTTMTVPLTRDLAFRICSIWDQMIQRVRKPDADRMGFDGETIEFSSPKGKGEIWSPMQSKSPLMLVELGQSLADYCQAAPEKRASELKKIEKQAAALEKYLKTHQP